MFILNESEYTTTKGSKYTGDLQGAMYAVLDNTKNWNRICEAASLMELQYYNEHGANVWAMDEAAMPGFLTAILNFLKKLPRLSHFQVKIVEKSLEVWYKNDD